MFLEEKHQILWSKEYHFGDFLEVFIVFCQTIFIVHTGYNATPI